MWEVLLRGAGTLPLGSLLVLTDGVTATLISRAERGSARVIFRGLGPQGVLAHAEREGVIPLPPYIEAARKKAAEEGQAVEVDDRTRYQTVFAHTPGAVAAPTAGLHFTEALLDRLVDSGHEIAKLTLHVGPGTFRTVEVDDPTQHPMDFEEYEVGDATAQALLRAQRERRPIVAVGTTVVRTLETLGQRGIAAGRGATNLFLTPGARFSLVTDLVTNFHLPRSTLLMLVAAFAGRETVLEAYDEAIAQGYRFYSYGDAMLLRRHDVAASASP